MSEKGNPLLLPKRRLITKILMNNMQGNMETNHGNPDLSDPRASGLRKLVELSSSEVPINVRQHRSPSIPIPPTPHAHISFTLFQLLF